MPRAADTMADRKRKRVEPPPPKAEDFSSAVGTAAGRATVIGHSEAVQPAHLEEGIERRLTRIEEWKALHVTRTDALEQRVTDLSDGASYLRANMLTKDMFAIEKSEQGKQAWVVAGVVIGAVAVIVAVVGVIVALLLAPKDSDKVAPPAPIIVQLPAPPAAPVVSPKTK